MATHRADGAEGGGASKAVRTVAEKAARSGGDMVDAKRGQVAHALDEAADTLGTTGETVPEPARGYARTAKDKLHGAAGYVRDHDAEEMGRDVMHAVTVHPVASLLMLSAVVIGGSMLVAAMLQGDGRDATDSRRPRGLVSTAASGLGPKGAETLSRIRDAALGFAVAKAVDTINDMFPGFREHYERG